MKLSGAFDNLLEINRNKDGNYYFIYRVEAPRSINPGAKRKADEILIVGVPQNKLCSYLNACAKGGSGGT